VGGSLPKKNRDSLSSRKKCLNFLVTSESSVRECHNNGESLSEGEVSELFDKERVECERGLLPKKSLSKVEVSEFFDKE
jgi:hypothetical protein